MYKTTRYKLIRSLIKTDSVLLNCIDAKPTLKEELAAEKEEALREKKYEDIVSRRSKMSPGKGKHQTF